MSSKTAPLVWEKMYGRFFTSVKWKRNMTYCTFLLFSEVGLKMVSSGLLGLGLGDSQELIKFMMNGSKCWPFWKKIWVTCHLHNYRKVKTKRTKQKDFSNKVLISRSLSNPIKLVNEVKILATWKTYLPLSSAFLEQILWFYLQLETNKNFLLALSDLKDIFLC